MPKNKVNRALTIAGNWTGEFVAIVSLLPFAGGTVAGITKYFVYFFSIISIFTFGIVGAFLGGIAGGIWHGILVGIRLSKRMLDSILGTNLDMEEDEESLFKNPFKKRRKADSILKKNDDLMER